MVGSSSTRTRPVSAIAMASLSDLGECATIFDSDAPAVVRVSVPLTLEPFTITLACWADAEARPVARAAEASLDSAERRAKSTANNTNARV